MNFEKTLEQVKELAEKIKLLGNEFEVNLDQEGGYIEVNGITVNFDDEMNVINSVVQL
ncbi:hypothetical protein [Vibrio cholerae]|uniref:hypothetical protein n=1 Tax=Vibrio cholerae TaxID=666 RepID=UPI00131F026B|nr:hypothetical protein [Vibrio cholerae]